MFELQELLKVNAYPGRGIVIGKSSDGTHAVIIYFIMGRSENSRNRIFVEKDGGIITQAFDPSKLSDPSLIIYSPVRVLDNTLIVTNGDQTDTVYDFVKEGKSFEEALRTRTFEPDAPNFTPRISGMLNFAKGDFSFKMSILKTDGGNADFPEKYFFEYDKAMPGYGKFIHTYRTDGNPIPSFDGTPKTVKLDGDIDDIANNVWKSLNADNKVSLFVRTIQLCSGESKTVIINKNS